MCQQADLTAHYAVVKDLQAEDTFSSKGRPSPTSVGSNVAEQERLCDSVGLPGPDDGGPVSAPRTLGALTSVGAVCSMMSAWNRCRSAAGASGRAPLHRWRSLIASCAYSARGGVSMAG